MALKRRIVVFDMQKQKSIAWYEMVDDEGDS